jgi:hypothetical protein
MNYKRLAERRIPGLNKIQEREKLPPEGHRKITGPESIRRAKPLVDAVISGAVPLDEATKDAIALLGDAEYRKFRRLARG